MHVYLLTSMSEEWLKNLDVDQALDQGSVFATLEEAKACAEDENRSNHYDDDTKPLDWESWDNGKAHGAEDEEGTTYFRIREFQFA